MAGTKCHICVSLNFNIQNLGTLLTNTAIADIAIEHKNTIKGGLYFRHNDLSSKNAVRFWDYIKPQEYGLLLGEAFDVVLSMAAAPDIDVGTVMDLLATEAVILWQEVSKRNRIFFGPIDLCHHRKLAMRIW